MGLHCDEDFWLLLNSIFWGGFIGGRILYLIEYVPFTWSELRPAIFAVNKGFSVMGAFGGIAASVWIFASTLLMNDNFGGCIFILSIYSFSLSRADTIRE